jgi:fructokinase
MKVTCIGEMLIDFVCTDINSGLLKGQHYIRKPGGAPANVAACIGKLGGCAYMVGAVGNDPFAEYLLQELRQYQVNTEHVYSLPQSTTLAFVSLAGSGEREFAFNRGADEQLVLSQVAIEELSQDAILHLGSATALLGGPLNDSYLECANVASSKGNIICFDPNFRIDLWKGREALFRSKCDTYFDLADIVKVSDEELLLLSQAQELETGCAYLHRKGVKIVLVTLGSKGCLVSQNGQQYIVPAREIDVVDTTGAGDAFIGAILYQMSQHSAGDDFYAQHIHGFVEFATKVSGLVCSKIGAMTALPTLAEVTSMAFKSKG